MQKAYLHDPIHIVSRQILKAIYGNIFSIGDRLEGEYELSKKFNVGRPTMRQAIREIEMEGLVERFKGKGIPNPSVLFMDTYSGACSGAHNHTGEKRRT